MEEREWAAEGSAMVEEASGPSDTPVVQRVRFSQERSLILAGKHDDPIFARSTIDTKCIGGQREIASLHTARPPRAAITVRERVRPRASVRFGPGTAIRHGERTVR
jgi:hypothetical protein